MVKIIKRSRRPSAMDPETYKLVFDALSSGHHGATKTAKEENQKWHRVSRFLRKWPGVRIQKIYNPVTRNLEDRLVFPTNDAYRIIIRTNEIDEILESFYRETIGDGALKLTKRIQKVFVGLHKSGIQKWLNKKPSVQKNKPQFQNCAPLIPVGACSVMERNQVDLVDMRSVGGEGDYNYILSVIDVFSRYLFLKALKSKTSEEVAGVLGNVYDVFGPPKILQADRGTEFKGAVRLLMSRLGVRIILSAPYKPESQGKAERSHASWKSKLRLQLEELNGTNDNFQWINSLETVTRLYNEGYHSSLGMCT